MREVEITQEELNEIQYALEKIQNLDDQQLSLSTLSALPFKSKSQDEVADGIGDMLVTIIILAELAGLNSVDCLNLAYDEIKGRKGKMVDGLFVKE